MAVDDELLGPDFAFGILHMAGSISLPNSEQSVFDKLFADECFHPLWAARARDDMNFLEQRAQKVLVLVDFVYFEKSFPTCGNNFCLRSLHHLMCARRDMHALNILKHKGQGKVVVVGSSMWFDNVKELFCPATGEEDGQSKVLITPDSCFLLFLISVNLVFLMLVRLITGFISLDDFLGVKRDEPG